MIYPDSFEQKTGFETVRSLVEAECSHAGGRTCCRGEEMEFSCVYEKVRLRLLRTAEMLRIVSGNDDGSAGVSGDAFPSGAVHQLDEELARLRLPGTWLPEEELVKLRVSLGTLQEIDDFFSSRRTDEGLSPFPALDELARSIRTQESVCREIDRVLDRHGQVKDTASPELAQLRRAISRTQASVASTMRRVLADAVRDGYVDPDTTPSVRDGRLVIPVAPMHKRRIPGITHDESASGKTFYIEPAAVVEANNHLRELHIEERHEVARILTAVADFIRPELDSIRHEAYPLLGLFDFIHAKARFAAKSGGTLPHLSPQPEIEWYGARHPVLERKLRSQDKEIVPLDLRLDGSKARILVVSGPNAGGKSVVLKTVAITQYMMQCGLLPCLHDNSHMGIMENLLLDIGDNQSIENDLSTYSSHLQNMKTFLRVGNDRTLMLIDEFGGGTEPQLGGAIAQALLHAFNGRGMWGIITTHYHNLKQYAEETPGLVNGSMLYDRNRMAPTFKLAVGQPGSSFALEIARKTGLPESILDEARSLVGNDYVNLDKYLLDIARDRRYWESKRRDIKEKNKRLDELTDNFSAEAETLRARRREIIAEAREEARKILANSNAVIERTIREIREAQADKEKTRQARERLQAERNALEKESEDSSGTMVKNLPRQRRHKAPKAAAPQSQDRPLEVGDTVVIEGGQTVGTIAEISGKKAIVVFGQLKTSVALDKLKRTIRKATSPTRRPGEGANASYLSDSTAEQSRRRQLNFKNEIDLRGMRVDEAVQAVMYYIDDAIQFNAGRVRILHGTGTGALRQYIREYLASVPAVKNYHDEDVRFGGAGITVVEL